MAKKKPIKTVQNLTPEELAKKALAKYGTEFRLDPIDHAILTMMQMTPAITIQQIADQLDYSRTQISIRVNRPGFQEAQRKMMRDIGQLAIDTFCQMFRECAKIMNGSDLDAKLVVIKALSSAWGKMEQAPTSQNLVFATMIGDGGALIQNQRQMTKEEMEKLSMRNIIEGEVLNH